MWLHVHVVCIFILMYTCILFTPQGEKKWRRKHICYLTMPVGLRLKAWWCFRLQDTTNVHLCIRMSSNAIPWFFVSGSRTLTLPKNLLTTVHSLKDSNAFGVFLFTRFLACSIVAILTEIYKLRHLSTPCSSVWFSLHYSWANFGCENCWSVPVLTTFRRWAMSDLYIFQKVSSSNHSNHHSQYLPGMQKESKRNMFWKTTKHRKPTRCRTRLVMCVPEPQGSVLRGGVRAKIVFNGSRRWHESGSMQRSGYRGDTDPCWVIALKWSHWRWRELYWKVAIPAMHTATTPTPEIYKGLMGVGQVLDGPGHSSGHEFCKAIVGPLLLRCNLPIASSTTTPLQQWSWLSAETNVGQ